MNCVVCSGCGKGFEVWLMRPIHSLFLVLPPDKLYCPSCRDALILKYKAVQEQFKPFNTILREYHMSYDKLNKLCLSGKVECKSWGNRRYVNVVQLYKVMTDKGEDRIKVDR